MNLFLILQNKSGPNRAKEENNAQKEVKVPNQDLNFKNTWSLPLAPCP